MILMLFLLHPSLKDKLNIHMIIQVMLNTTLMQHIHTMYVTIMNTMVITILISMTVEILE